MPPGATNPSKKGGDQAIGNEVLKLSDRQNMRAQVGGGERQDYDKYNSGPAAKAENGIHVIAVKSNPGRPMRGDVPHRTIESLAFVYYVLPKGPLEPSLGYRSQC